MRTFNPLGPLYNISGHPALSLPVAGLDGATAPIGVTLGARLGEEATLLRLASALEQLRPWPLLVAARFERGGP
ncbi:MAG TPA: hypothetical protein VMU47_01455 [Caldimonas sp.]|nr:hypothetical protein [Caldimonas sp.]